MILSTLVTSQLHFEMCAELYGHPVYPRYLSCCEMFVPLTYRLPLRIQARISRETEFSVTEFSVSSVND